MLNSAMEKLDPARSFISPPEVIFHDFKTPERQTITNYMTSYNSTFPGINTPASTSKQAEKNSDDNTSSTPLSPPPTPATPNSLFVRDRSESLAKPIEFNDPQLYESSVEPEGPLFPSDDAATSATTPMVIDEIPQKQVIIQEPTFIGCGWTVTFSNPRKRLLEELKWREERKKAAHLAFMKSSRGGKITPPATPRVSHHRRERSSGDVRTVIRKPVNRIQKPSLPKRPKPVNTTRNNVDFESIPDMSPPLESLNAAKSKLKTQWKGRQLDLSDDEHRGLLHKNELEVASTLRLSCAQYLSSKRLIFEARVSYAKKGLDFKKTDSQRACNIDVNKASKLWEAFNSVGWFDAKWLQPYL